MKENIKLLVALVMLAVVTGCNGKPEKTGETGSADSAAQEKGELTAADILGNPDYKAISFGAYRHVDHGIEPTMEELKEDVRLLSAMGIRVLRTYKVHLPQAANLLQAISELKKEDPKLEMYVMLGAWIDCKNAWTDQEPDHEQESEANATQIAEAVRLANLYPDIVKIMAVGNEAMIRWAEAYYVQPSVIVKWVNYLQDLKESGELPKDLWITCSDNFASWGGGDTSYHTEDLEKLIRAVDYVSMHTYPFLDSHYNPDFWGVPEEENGLSDIQKIENSVLRAKEFAIAEYRAVAAHVHGIDPKKPIHIGETGWATVSDGFFGPEGSRAADEYKNALYYRHMREWTEANGISCFYFEAFNEPWKDGPNPKGSENHFGLFTVEGKAKYVLWDLVDKGVFEGLSRNGNPVVKTYGGDADALMRDVLVPPTSEEIASRK